MDDVARASDWKAYVALIVTAPEPHADIEDKILFTALEGYLPLDSGPLAVMRSKHDEIRSTLNRILEESDPDAMQLDILRFLEVVYAHFSKEEQVLFPLAQQALDPGLRERLGEHYGTARGLGAP